MSFFIGNGSVSIAPSLDENPHILDESSYLRSTIYTRVIGHSGVVEYKLGANEYFLVGDNRSRSVDSRVYGPIHRSRIVGKIVNRI